MFCSAENKVNICTTYLVCRGYHLFRHEYCCNIPSAVAPAISIVVGEDLLAIDQHILSEKSTSFTDSAKHCSLFCICVRTTMCIFPLATVSSRTHTTHTPTTDSTSYAISHVHKKNSAVNKPYGGR